MQEFDDIYDKEITKKYDKHELQRLPKKKIEKGTLVPEELSNGCK